MDRPKTTFHLERAFRLASFLVIAMAVFLLYGFTAYHALLVRPWGDVAVAVLIIGFIYSMAVESRKLVIPEEDAMGPMLCIKSFVFVIIGASIAFVLKVDLGLGAVLAASLVSLMASILIPAYGVPIALGGFVGMTSSRLLVSHAELSYAAAIAGLVYLCTDRVFNGFGGKLGTIAFVGTFITGMGLSREFIISPFPRWESVGIIIIVSIISAVATYWLSVYRNHGPVMASGIVGIAVGLLLPHYFPGDEGQTLAVMAMCASYAGMTGKARIPNLYLMAIVGLFCGLIFIFSMPLAGGAGGKLGTIAFGAVLAVRGYVDMAGKLKTKTFGKTTRPFLRNIILLVQATVFFYILFFPRSVIAQNSESSVWENQATSDRVYFQGNLEHDRLVECSGMDVSLANTNLLWAINDSGDGPYIYALGHDGSNRGRILIHHADNRDWEGLATFFWQDRPMILIADFGDNDEKYNDHTLYVIEEPKVPGDRINDSTVIQVAWKIVFSYPDHKHDAESVAVDTNSGKVLVLTKRDNPPLLYELPLVPPSLGDRVTALRLTELRNIPPPSSDDLKLKYGIFRSQPTDMDISPDGLRIVVLTYKHAYMFERTPRDSWAEALKEPPVLIPLPLPQDRKDIRQREAICFSPDGKGLFVTSEGKKAGLFRIEAR